MGFGFEVAAVAILAVEGVIKTALERVHAISSGVNWQFGIFAYREATQVVKADHVIGVLVGVQNGIEMLDFLPQALGAKIGAGIDNPFHVRSLNIDGSSKAIVFWVV